MFLARIRVTGRTIFKVSDPFFDMLCANLSLGVCMAAIAGVLRVVIPDVTGLARLAMSSIEHEIGIVIEGGR